MKTLMGGSLVAVSLLMAVPADAAGVYKCMTPKGVVYQGMPCADGEQSKPMLTDSTADLSPYVIQDRKEKVVEADRRLVEAQARQHQAEIKYERSKERYEFEKAKAIARESRPIIVITR